jgi:predicted nucleic-acid-binding protein
MIALDTNVLVRILTRDDQSQVKAALRRVRGKDLWMSKTVLLETEWVLRYSYRLSRPAIHGALRRLLGYRLAQIEDRQAVVLALAGYEAGLDFADALHLASAAGADLFLTFDRDLVRRTIPIKGVPAVERP